MHSTLNLAQALEIVKSAGYKVSSPRARAKATAPQFNCLGLPMSASYDPKYKMQYKTPLLRNDHKSIGPGISPERWTEMCRAAQTCQSAQSAV